jgi:hypothetical protein
VAQVKDEHAEDLHAELGYRTTGRREIAQREWFSLRGDVGEVAPNPKAFKVLAKRLEKLRSRRKKPEKYRAATLAYYAAHKEHLDFAAKEYRAAHKTETAKRSRAWYLAHKAVVLERGRARYAAKGKI